MQNDPDTQPPPALTGIPETMLWTLYARAEETRSGSRRLDDPEAVRIRDAIPYDFAGRFGPPNPLFALRAALIDGALRAFLARHPDGLIVSLGEGLETQRHRVDNGRMRWLSVDLPEAMHWREVFLKPGGRFRHLAASALDSAWMDQAEADGPVFIVAQGLLMYLKPEDVRRLLGQIARRFPGGRIIFDIVPRALSEETQRGHRQSETYTLPPMPFGLDRQEILPTLRNWGLPVSSLRFLPYRLHRRFPAPVEDMLDRILPRRRGLANLVQLSF